MKGASAKYGLIGVESKGVAAIQALQVVEKGLVELVTESGTGLSAGNTSNQTANHGSGDAAEQRSSRARDLAQCHANPGATGGSCYTTSGTSSCADGATYPASVVECRYPDRLAAGTLNDHETSMRWVRKVIPSWLHGGDMWLQLF